MSLSPNFYNYAQQLINTISNPLLKSIAQNLFNIKQAAGSEDARSILDQIAIAQPGIFNVVDPFGAGNPEPVEVKFFRDNIGFELVQNVTALMQSSTNESECCTNNTNAITNNSIAIANNTFVINELSIQVKNITNITNSNAEDISIIVSFLDSANITDFNFTKVHRQLHHIDDAIEALENQINASTPCCANVTANITTLAATVQSIQEAILPLPEALADIGDFTEAVQNATECCSNNSIAIQTLQTEVANLTSSINAQSLFALHRDTFIICADNNLYNTSGYTPAGALAADLVNSILADPTSCQSVCLYPDPALCTTVLACILNPSFSPPIVSSGLGCSILECSNATFPILSSLGFIGQVFANEVASELCA